MQKNILDAYNSILWSRLCKFLKGSVVYLDDGTAECLHWSGGLGYFLEKGVRAVKKFHESEHPSGYWDEVVFILNGPLVGAPLEVIRKILEEGQFIKCTVITSDPNRGHVNTHASIKNNLLDWMGSKKFEATVLCLPIFVGCISPRLFVMPPFAHLFPPLDTWTGLGDQNNRPEIQKSCFGSTPDEIHMKALCFCLDSFLSEMNVKEDVFVWGQLSHAVGMELLKLPGFKSRRKNHAQQKASLILLDRTLDLSPCLTHQCDCLLDSVVRALPQLPGHSCGDVAVDITPLLYPDVQDHNREGLGLPPGCLAGQDKTSVLNSIIFSKSKECLMEINRQLVSVGSQHGISLKSAGSRITPESLLQKIQAFGENPSSTSECLDLLQQSLAVVECLQSSKHEKESMMLSTERLLIQNLMASQEGPSRNLLHIMAHMKERKMTLEDVVILMAHLSSVCNGMLWGQDEEERLQGALAEAVFQDLANLPPFFKNIVGDETQEGNVLAGISHTFKLLKTISKGRQNFRKYRSVLSQENPALPATYSSVFHQLLLDILDPSRPDIPDLQCISTGITDMLKSGLGLFMNVQKPHPNDNPLLIMIILGGVTGSEVKIFQDTVAASRKAPQLVVGTTRICKPCDILDSVFQLVIKKQKM